jgi:RNA polymerase sigma-70 factor (ECF subfamily)
MEATESALPGLVAAIAMRDGDALARLVEICLPRVYGLALRITRSPLLAEDVAQGVFVDIWNKAAPHAPHVGSPLAWFAALCRDRALAAMRATSVGTHAADASIDRPATAPEMSSEDDLQDLLVATRHSRTSNAALRQLDQRQRELLRLAFFEGLDLHELADRLDLPVGTVEARLNSARAALKGDSAHAAAA